MQPTEAPKFIPQIESRIRWLKSLEEPSARRYFKTFFKAHDQTAGAMLRAAFYLIAARAGVGKTAYLFSLAYLQAMAGIKVYFCNLEMSVEQMWNRLACLRDPDLTLRELNEGERTSERLSISKDWRSSLKNSRRFFSKAPTSQRCSPRPARKSRNRRIRFSVSITSAC